MKENHSLLPIGFFDSGVGGIAVLKQAMQLMPNESYIYYGDSGNMPYGSKTEEQIKSLSLDCGEFLFQKGIKAIVMACNTATSISVQKLRSLYKIPVISIEPAVKPAVESLREGYVMVLATPATISQERYARLLERVGHTNRIINIPCTRLANMIETLDPDSPAIREYVLQKYAPHSGKKIDGIVLGCTHYSFIADTIADAAKKTFCGSCALFDGKYGTARQLQRVLEREGLLNKSGSKPCVQFYTSGKEEEIALYKKFLAF